MKSEDRLEALLLRWEELADAGQELPAEELCRDCPELTEELRRRIEALREMEWLSGLQGTLTATRPHGNGSLNGELVPLVAGAEPVTGYRLIRRIGKGGFGEVWQAAGPDDSVVALKLVPWTGSAVSEWRALRALKDVQHPHLLNVLATWQTEGLLVIALELADRTLMERLQEAREQGLTGIPRGELLDYFRQAAEGIDYLHGRDIQHRDIKPQNLLLKGTTLKVADFGLARVLAHSVTGHTGNLTLAYAAPEFFDGRTTRHSDQYSLAVAYCQLRGGRLPFSGSTAQIVAGHLGREPDLTMLPEEERAVVGRALAKQPDERWPNCPAFVAALTTDSQKTQPLRKKRRRGLLVLVLLSLLLVVGVSLLALWPHEQGSLQQPVEAAPRSAFVFDGKSRIVTPLQRFAPCTLEAWVWLDKPTTGKADRFVIGSDIPEKSGISLGVHYPYFSPEAKTWRWDISPVLITQVLPDQKQPYRGMDTPVVVSHAQWLHLAAVFGESRTLLFVDGKRVVDGVPSASYGDTPFVVGSAGKENRAHYFVGRMRAVRVSRGARYASDFTPTASFRPDEQAVLIYDAARTEGETAIDLSGHNKHGVMEGVTVENGENGGD
jgi:serine/threonine protein kinase